jgi:EAL domain-containing protein (putative c-di-GMP-specific phosphodiesterase class I)/CHASE2 domain-containing sensor protein
VAGLAGIAASLVLAWSGQLGTWENGLRALIFGIGSRPASGQLHLVEMDAASIARIDRWPWPRRHYARVIDQLNRAGVRSITFDVDLSARSTPLDDRLMAAAIARSRAMVALPTFAQRARTGERRQLDSLPLPEFRRHATLASVAVAPDADGVVRRMPFGTVTEGVPRPSISALLAGRAGEVDRQFPIDFAIDPATIPRHSFVAVEDGKVPAAALRGRDVLIGATAIEMGDRYAVPRHGVLNGVVLQALATETLRAGAPRFGGWPAPVAVALLLLCWVGAARGREATVRRGAAALLLLFGLGWMAWAMWRLAFPLMPGLVAIAVATALQAAGQFRRELRQRQLVDEESGLPNARAFRAAAAATGGGHSVAAMIDGYDRLPAVLQPGEAALLIRRLAERLATAAGGVTIHRTDARTLAWLTPLGPPELDELLAGLTAVMRSPIEIGGRGIDVRLGFGIAQAGALAEATLAAGEALRAGTPWRYDVAAERDALADQLSLMGELDAAVARGELHLLYQPKLHLASDRIASVEALVRWTHPTRGALRPDLFIPLAEESDRILDLTLWTLRQALADLAAWRAAGFGLTAAVNISARLVGSPAFAAAAAEILAAAGDARTDLIFEVTESAAIADTAAAAAALVRFRDLGVAISMDDYGTGHSTLSYLKQLPLSELKIDRAFVQFAHRERSDALMVRSTVDLAHELGLRVVAEGVEEPACLAFLRSIGCDYAQGYLIARPLTAADLLTRVRDHAAPAREAG